MQLDMLRELQNRGRVFWGMFPGARAGDEWQRHHERLARPGQHGAASQRSRGADGHMDAGDSGA